VCARVGERRDCLSRSRLSLVGAESLFRKARELNPKEDQRGGVRGIEVCDDSTWSDVQILKLGENTRKDAGVSVR
jgi:hypothetical protein